VPPTTSVTSAAPSLANVCSTNDPLHSAVSRGHPAPPSPMTQPRTPLDSLWDQHRRAMRTWSELDTLLSSPGGFNMPSVQRPQHHMRRSLDDEFRRAEQMGSVERGGRGTTADLEVGSRVMYHGGPNGVCEPATVLDVHHDDQMDLYYTISINGQERSTVRHKLSPIGAAGGSAVFRL
jgi:hypothetical protein